MKMRISLALRNKLAPHEVGGRMRQIADQNFVRLYQQHPSSRALAAHLGMSISFVNRHRRRLGLPPKFGQGGRSTRALKNPIKYRGKTQALVLWVHELYCVPHDRLNQVCSVVYSRYYRDGAKPEKLFRPINGVAYR